jgi:hypothetical protein
MANKIFTWETLKYIRKKHIYNTSLCTGCAFQKIPMNCSDIFDLIEPKTTCSKNKIVPGKPIEGRIYSFIKI